MRNAATVPVLPSLRGIQALVALARTGSARAAAGRLGVTRSAISHRIADLEAQLGVAMIRKEGRGSVLTDDGEALLAAMGDAIERIEAAVAPLRRQRNRLKLSTVATFAANWLIPHLPAFRAAHRPVDFAVDDVDCAIRHGRGRWPDLSSALLFRETLVPVAIPQIAARVANRRADRRFHAETLIVARSRALDWPVWWRHAGLAGAPRLDGLTVETRAQALEAALAGVGIAITDEAYVANHLAAGRLERLSGQRVLLSEGYYFVHRPQPKNTRLVGAMRSWLEGATLPLRESKLTPERL
jgi:DNA-binding transcriptional LysR family regulator